MAAEKGEEWDKSSFAKLSNAAFLFPFIWL